MTLSSNEAAGTLLTGTACSYSSSVTCQWHACWTCDIPLSSLASTVHGVTRSRFDTPIKLDARPRICCLWSKLLSIKTHVRTHTQTLCTQLVALQCQVYLRCVLELLIRKGQIISTMSTLQFQPMKVSGSCSREQGESEYCVRPDAM